MDPNLIGEVAGLVIQLLFIPAGVIVAYYANKWRLGREARELGLRALGKMEEWSRQQVHDLGAKVEWSRKRRGAAQWFRDNASPAILRYVGPKIEDWLESLLGVTRLMSGTHALPPRPDEPPPHGDNAGKDLDSDTPRRR